MMDLPTPTEAVDHRTDSLKRDGWEPGIDLAIRECHACGRDAMVAVLAPTPHTRHGRNVDVCRPCLLAAVAVIDADAAEGV